MSGHHLAIENLRCEKGNQRLFSSVQFSLNAGDILHVTGENGSGKTTLLRIIAGLNRDYVGNVFWHGNNIREQWHTVAPAILYQGHQPALKTQLTARENLQWYAHCSGVSDNNIDAALLALGLRGKTGIPCYQLSAGQQRRVVLARLMFSTQPLWILDEPFTAIDTNGLPAILQCLRSHRERGGITIMTSHHGMETLDLPHKTLPLGMTAEKKQVLA